MRSSWLVLAACGGPAQPPPIANAVPRAPVTVEVTPARASCGQPDLSRVATRANVVGVVCDASTREWLAGVTAVLDRGGSEITAITDDRGVFALSIAAGDYAVSFHYADITEKRAVHVSSTRSLIVQAMDLRQPSP
jgi:hypothetical protein